MKIYEKPLADIKTFDVEDVMTTSTATTAPENNYSSNTSELFKAINPDGQYDAGGVLFKW